MKGYFARLIERAAGSTPRNQALPAPTLGAAGKEPSYPFEATAPAEPAWTAPAPASRVEPYAPVSRSEGSQLAPTPNRAFEPRVAAMPALPILREPVEKEPPPISPSPIRPAVADQTLEPRLVEHHTVEHEVWREAAPERPAERRPLLLERRKPEAPADRPSFDPPVARPKSPAEAPRRVTQTVAQLEPPEIPAPAPLPLAAAVPEGPRLVIGQLRVEVTPLAPPAPEPPPRPRPRERTRRPEPPSPSRLEFGLGQM